MGDVDIASDETEVSGDGRRGGVLSEECRLSAL
jgi:hypothetical protein